ncbi:hemolysin XhlA family protein [Sporanaerobacter acetigenes]|uniref:hemolysin XhlA family protein n=1 Tax=Sporanaerobacter acetigenes TaxID=165813 RepID=UPI0010523640|nr:hemolysin XhlA family protein [Sporanaerobacter acetigenes]
MNNEVMEMKITEHDKKILELDKRMDENERENAEFRIQIENLCKDIQSLTVTMKWFMGLLIGSFVGFFFYAAQKGLLK